MGENSTLPKLLSGAAASFKQTSALMEKKLGEWRSITWSHYFHNSKLFALGLAKLGLLKGQSVAILAYNCPEWLYADLAIQALGGVTLPISPFSTAAEVGVILKDHRPAICITADHEQTDKVLESAGMPFLRNLVVFSSRGLQEYDQPVILSLDRVLDMGKSMDEAHPGFFERALDSLNPDDPACSNGAGLLFSHRDLIRAADIWLERVSLFRRDAVVSYLPFSNVYERLLSQVLPLKVGYRVAFASGSDVLEASFREISPTLIAGTARALEALAASPLDRIARTKGIRRWLCEAALSSGKKMNAHSAHERPSIYERTFHLLARMLVLRPICNKMGLSATRLIFCTDRDIRPEHHHLFTSLGIPLRWVETPLGDLF